MFLGPINAKPSAVLTSLVSGEVESSKSVVSSSTTLVSSVVSFVDLVSNIPKKIEPQLKIKTDYDGLFIAGFVNFSKVTTNKILK